MEASQCILWTIRFFVSLRVKIKAWSETSVIFKLESILWFHLWTYLTLCFNNFAFKNFHFNRIYFLVFHFVISYPSALHNTTLKILCWKKRHWNASRQFCKTSQEATKWWKAVLQVQPMQLHMLFAWQFEKSYVGS